MIGVDVVARARPGLATTGLPVPMPTFAALIEALDLRDAMLVGHSTRGGAVNRYIGRHGASPTRRRACEIWSGVGHAGRPQGRGDYDRIKAFSETDCTVNVKQIEAPTLIVHGADDQIVPVADTGQIAAKLAPGATLKVYPGAPQGPRRTTSFMKTRLLSWNPEHDRVES